LTGVQLNILDPIVMAKQILLVDDEPHILRAAEIKLTRSGFTVRCAVDGQQGWEMILQQKPDLLVTDLQMPRMDGFELTRHVRENPATADLPVLMLTAKGLETSLGERASELKVLTVLPKPFSPRELVRCIERALETQPVVCVGLLPATNPNVIPTPIPNPSL
jgi:two-component system alkaline phosphatase synthesis response regulator PhoP